MRKIIIISLAAIFLFAGCSNKDYIRRYYIYKGDSESWTGVYRVDYTGQFYKKDGRTKYKSSEKYVLTITYKGELSDLSDVKHLNIEYNYLSERGIADYSFTSVAPSSKTFTYTGGGGGHGDYSGNPIPYEDAVVKVTITADRGKHPVYSDTREVETIKLITET